ncbi:LysE family translocator [Thalassospira lucentensis]|uniref:LysE family translocator n=1 Tax=Thalassospira lucentensis TaxID=168935 RepID=UPI00142E5A0E|nr:LysE family translocator [Thalassospira lucentensis]NIZ00968.1 LysE family translocator [Thalassospira lucentensis]
MLIPLETLAIFIPTALALNMTPGNDMLFCLGQGLKSGPGAGNAASLGIATGSMIHTLLAGLGLAALVAAHPIALEVLRWAGIAYLVWLAIAAFRSEGPSMTAAKTQQSSAFHAWRDGIVVNLLNPKIIVFVLAFIPQFVDASRGSVLVQFLIFGLILNIGGTVINCLVGSFAGKLGKVLSQSARLARAFQVFTGCIFLGLAAKLAFERRV